MTAKKITLNTAPKFKPIDTRFIARAALIAALYTVLTVAVLPLAYGPVQFRISEALTILPVFFIEAVPGLAAGCLIANIFSGMPWDMLIGTLATLIAAVLTRLLKKPYLAVLPPIIINALLVPLIFILSGDLPALYWINVLTVGGGQAAVVLGLGLPLYFGVKSLTVSRKGFYGTNNK